MCPISSVYPRGITFPGFEYSSVTTGENTEGEQKYISLVWAVPGPYKSTITREGSEIPGEHGSEGLLCYVLLMFSWPWFHWIMRFMRTLHWARVISWFGGRTELIDFWFPRTWLADMKGTYDSWTNMLRDDNLQGTRRGGWTEKSLSRSPCSYFYHYEPFPCTGKEFLSLENEMGHENHGSATLFLDLMPVFSCVDSGLGPAWFTILWSQETHVADECGPWLMTQKATGDLLRLMCPIKGLLGLRDSGWHFSIFLMSLCPRLGIFWNTINKC